MTASAAVSGRCASIHTRVEVRLRLGGRCPAKSKYVHHAPKPTTMPTSATPRVSTLTGTCPSPNVTPRHGLAQHDDDQEPEPLDEGIGDGEGAIDSGGGHRQNHDESDEICGADHSPREDPGIDGEKSAQGKRDSASRGACHERATGTAWVIGPVPPRSKEPERGEDRKECGGRKGECYSPVTVGSGDVRSEGYEGEDLQQEQRPSSGILAAVQFVVKGAVEPADPHQGEYRGEFAQPRRSEVFGQLSGGPGNQHDHRQVVEQLEWADDPLPWLLSMRSRRLPQQEAQAFPSLRHGHALRDDDGNRYEHNRTGEYTLVRP